jgi:DNA-directed RNA polymerase specialized sigma24 family protein
VETLAAAQNAATSPDEALVRRARLGDAAAFNSLVASRIDRCYRLAWSILLNDADAADATQDAFVAYQDRRR